LLKFSSTLRMEAICSSETSAEYQRTTRHYISEDRTLHNHRCENLRFHWLTLFIFFVSFFISLVSSDYCLLGCDAVYSGRYLPIC
jgi:hypothetical protein